MKVDAPRRSIAKTLSWRLVSLVITFIVAIAITRSAKFAISISFVDTLIKLFAYYFHERCWTTVKWGRLKKKKKKKKKKHAE